MKSYLNTPCCKAVDRKAPTFSVDETVSEDDIFGNKLTKRPCWVEKPEKVQFEIKGKVRERTQAALGSVGRGSKCKELVWLEGQEGGKSEHKALPGSGWEDSQGGSSHTKFYRLQPRVELIPFVISEAPTSFKSIFSNTSQGTEISKNLRNASSTPVTVLHLSLVPGSPCDSLSDTTDKPRVRHITLRFPDVFWAFPHLYFPKNKQLKMSIFEVYFIRWK